MDALSPDEALNAVLDACVPVDSRWIKLEDVGDWILREALLADRAMPPFDRVMMDGIGVKASSLEAGIRSFIKKGTQQAGISQLKLENPQACLEVMTGAVLPDGVDTILPVEWLEQDEATATLVAGNSPEAGAFIHRMGSDYAEGSVLLEAGNRLNPAVVSLAASCGYANIKVPCKIHLGLISTGDEALPIEAEPGPYQIRQSNRIMIASALRKAPVEVLIHQAHLPDNPQQIHQFLDPLLPTLDLLVISGGVSKGRFDFFKQLLSDWKAELIFDRVLQRPGQPLSFAQLQEKLIFGLPGNPNASLLGTCRYLLPALWKMAGGTPPEAQMGHLAKEESVRGSLVQWRPARWAPSSSSPGLWLEVLKPQNSGDFAKLALADGWVRLDPRDQALPKGLSVPFYPW